MSKKTYCVCLSAPLGQRDGTMVLQETGGSVTGRLKMLDREDTFSGQLKESGELTISGTIHSLVSTINYTATGTVSGRKLLLNLKTSTGACYPVYGEEVQPNGEVLQTPC